MRRFRLPWLLIAIALLATSLAVWIAVRMYQPRDPEAISLDQRDPRVRSEVDAIAGRWQSTSMVADGREVYSATTPWENYFLFSRDGLFWYSMISWVTGPDSDLPMEVRVDPNSSPARLDVIGGRSLWKGIYRREGDTLRIVLPFCAGDARPTTIDKGPAVSYLALRRAEPDSVDYYEKKLLDKEFLWYGPNVEIGTCRPSLYAARALGFFGDAAVPALFRAVRNEAIDLNSVLLALAEIGLPVSEYSPGLDRRDPSGLENWFAENGERTAAKRSQMRYNSGLPPVR